MATVQSQHTLLETIDLTGLAPVHGNKIVEKKVEIHNIDVDETATIATNPPPVLIDRRLKKCEICLEQFSKYTCPGCKIKTCCLSCTQKHKIITGCIGQRNKTGFVPKSAFNNFHLLNDYRFLEEANRISDNAKRDTRTNNARVSKKDQILQKNARKSGVQLYRMAKGMKRWKENKSYYNIKEQTLFWTMKIVFDGIEEDVLTKHPETITVKNLLSKYLAEDQVSVEKKKKFQLHIKSFQGDKIKIFFKNELESGQCNLRYSELDINMTIKEALNGKSILEYPSFYVVPPENTEKYMTEPFIPVPKSDSSDDESATDDENAAYDVDDDDGDLSGLQPAAKQRRI